MAAQPPIPSLQPLVLIGFMGSGKSAVARRLKPQLGLPRLDLDKQIETLAGQKIAHFFAEHGEEEFRRLETQALIESLAQPQIIATGGGVVTRAENRRVLLEAGQQGALVVYLRAGAEALSRRIRRQPGRRPLIDGDGVLDAQATLAKVTQLLEQREPWYHEVAGALVETDDLNIGQVAQTVRDLYQQQTDKRTSKA